MTHYIMIQGTTSDAGKTFFTALLCMWLRKKGKKACPFKSQNMSLNSYITLEGREIARSQVLQAWACGFEPVSDMNPILLKPSGRGKGQIVLNGKPLSDYNVNEYYSHSYREPLKQAIIESLNRLSKEYDIIVIEGAGSPAEINLYEKDLANMFVSRLVNAPVIFIADIERGGVFASLYGTIKLLPKEDQKRIKGFIINRFRGEKKILEAGIKKMEEILNIPCLGVIPYLNNLYLSLEDSLSFSSFLMENSFMKEKKSLSKQIHVGVIPYSYFSIFTDIEPLVWDPRVRLEFITNGEDLSRFDLLILPGTKNTIAALMYLRERQLFEQIIEAYFQGTSIIGICGGYEILGITIKDNAIESSEKKDYKGLGLLPIYTEFKEYKKITRRIRSSLTIGSREVIGKKREITIEGYEIHMGIVKKLEGNHNLTTKKGEEDSPFVEILKINNKPIGSSEGKKYEGRIRINKEKKNWVIGTFLHGLLDNSQFYESLIENLLQKRYPEDFHEILSSFRYKGYKRTIIENLQEILNRVENELAFDKILQILSNT